MEHHTNDEAGDLSDRAAANVVEGRDNVPEAQSPALTPPPPPPPGRSPNDHAVSYNFITDKVFGPSIRLSDNLVSLGSAILGAIVGVPVMYLYVVPTYELPMWGWRILLWGGIGAVGGVFAGVILSGLVLMVIGLARQD